jgi:sortase A
MLKARTLVTFFLALSGFLALGVGVVIVLPHGGASAPSQRAAAKTPTAVAQAGSSPAAPAPADYKLVDNLSTIPKPGEPRRIVIPSISLDAKVVGEGIVMDNGKPVWDTAAFAVGFYRNTALPGTIGNTVMAGHISSPVSKKGDVFRHLPEVRIGDRIVIYNGDQKVSYEVSKLRVVAPNSTQVFDQTKDATLTLLTCHPDNVYSKRLVVIGKLLGTST